MVIFIKKIIVAITGASGTILALRLLEELKKNNLETHTIISKGAIDVAKYELKNLDLLEKVRSLSTKTYDESDFSAKIASGSFRTDAMVVVPCSMKTLSSIATGYTDNLISRAADIKLRYHKPLILVPRETPLNAIHLENMLKLSRLGVKIVPPSIAYYHEPKTIDDMTDFIVGKILDSLEIDNNLYKRWGD